MGLRPSRLPWVCFVLGLLGAVAMLLFQYWATAVSWPINVGGKPWNSLPAFVPVTFEVMVLCAGVGTVVAFIWRDRDCGPGVGPRCPTCASPTIASRSRSRETRLRVRPRGHRSASSPGFTRSTSIEEPDL